MHVNHRSQLNIDILRAFLDTHWPQPVTKLEILVGGEDSQAVYFEADNRRFVLRINTSDYGFKKDQYAYEHFASERIPIPKVFQIGKVNDDHAYCVSEFIEGPTLQDLDQPAAEGLLPTTLQMLRIIADVDISRTSGYGSLDFSGNGRYASWQDWLLSHIAAPEFEWDEVVSMGVIQRTFLNKVFDTFKRLVDRVPNERRLFHGDFGSNNVITRCNSIVAVLDWDAAGYGDWLFDIAGAYYWQTHLPCMKLAADYYERVLNHLPNYQERINCYQLRASLIEMYIHAHRKEHERLVWNMNRCQEILNNVRA
jgi:hygromycin-B 4-O-kinase